MSQEIRRRLAARKRIQPPPSSEAEVPGPLRIRRFSEGIEHPTPDQPHVGRFSQGAEQLPDDAPGKTRVGRYSDGLDHEANAPHRQHVGRFSEGIDRSDV